MRFSPALLGAGTGLHGNITDRAVGVGRLANRRRAPGVRQRCWILPDSDMKERNAEVLRAEERGSQDDMTKIWRGLRRETDCPTSEIQGPKSKLQSLRSEV